MSLLPNVQQRELLQFHFAKNLSYSSRVVWAAALVIGGIGVEILLPYPSGALGAFLFFLAGVLLAAAGYTNKPELTGRGFWKNADVDRLDRILELHRKSRSWDVTALDVSNALGFLALVFLLLACGLVGFMLTNIGGGWGNDIPDILFSRPFFLLLASAAALFIPLWFSGMRAGYSNAELIIKAKMIRDLIRHFESVKQSGETAQLSLRLRGPEADATPDDVKLQISWPDASPDFYGLQGQVNINVVQGNKYPYCYFVVVAKRGMNIAPVVRELFKEKSTTIETNRQNDVEIIIVRQATTRTSGYHTKLSRCIQLMDVALVAARKVAETHPKTNG